jgi:hypothetical protein
MAGVGALSNESAFTFRSSTRAVTFSTKTLPSAFSGFIEPAASAAAIARSNRLHLLDVYLIQTFQRVGEKFDTSCVIMGGCSIGSGHIVASV